MEKFLGQESSRGVDYGIFEVVKHLEAFLGSWKHFHKSLLKEYADEKHVQTP